MPVCQEARSPTVEQPFEDLVDHLIERAEHGEQIDMKTLVGLHPQHAEPLRALWPALEAMFRLGQSSAGPSLQGKESAGPLLSSDRDAVVRLGDYEIQSELGRGGMGVVYQARQISLGREVALKILPFAALADDRQLQRFQNEARAAALLDHPGIVPIFAVGSERGVHYFTMQYIHGPTLAEVLNRLRSVDLRQTADHGDMRGHTAADAVVQQIEDHVCAQRSSSPREYFCTVAECGRQLAAALYYADQHGVIHRDIKPSNIVLDESDQVWILDFGLARIKDSPMLTTQGNLFGTWRYMSPEQATGGFVDHRTDIYSLGVTLYELLTLQPAIGGTGREVLARRIAEEEPVPLRRRDPSIPRDLATIVAKAIEKDPRDRYATAQGMADDLQRFLQSRPIMARPPSVRDRLGKWSRRHVAVLWTVVAMAILMGSLLAVSAYRAHVSKQQEELAKTQAIQDRDAARLNKYFAEIVSGQADWQQGNIGRLERKLIGHVPVGGETDHRGWEWYYLLSRCHPEQRTMFWPGLRPYVAWSPDGEYVASGNGIWKAASGELVRRFWPSHNRREGVDWSPDGQQFAWGVCADDSAIYLWDRATDELRALRGHESSVWHVAFHPDGRQLASGSIDGTVRIWDVASSSVLRALPAEEVVTDLDWSPDGRLLAVAEKTGLIIWRPSTAELIAQRDVDYFHHRRLSWSPDGRYLAVGQEDRWFLWNTADWTVEHAHEHPQCNGRDIAWSPDGDRIAVAHGEVVSIWKPWGAAPMATLVGHLRELKSVDWSPDGQQLVTSDDKQEIKIWDVDATSQPTVISSRGRLLSLAWRADSRTLQSITAEDAACVQWDAIRGIRLDVEPRVVAAETILSPDGRFATVRSDDGTSFEIRDTRTGSICSVWQADASHDVDGCFWSPDSTRLAISTTSGDHVLLEFWDVVQEEKISRWSKPLLADEDKGVVFSESISASWSPDGARVAAVGFGVPGDNGTQAWKKHVYVIDVAHGRQLLRHLPGGLFDAGYTSAFAWSRGGDMLAVGTSGRIELLDIPLNRPTMSAKLHSTVVRHLASHPDGTRLATAAQDGTVKLIEPMRGEELLTLQLKNTPTHLIWSPDGKRLAAGAEDGTIHVWDAARGYEFTPDGSRRDELAWAYDRRGSPLAWREFLKLAPDALAFWHLRGHADARLAMFDEAAAEFAKARRTPLEWSLDVATHHALALLGAGQTDAFRRACNNLFREVDGHELFSNDTEMARLRILAPMLDGPSQGNPPIENWERDQLEWQDYSLRVYAGAGLYREGRYETAIRVLSDVSAQLEQSAATFDLGDLATAQYFLAMAHQQLGHASTAHEYLQRATENAAQALEQPYDFLHRTRWVYKIQLSTLEREARALIK